MRGRSPLPPALLSARPVPCRIGCRLVDRQREGEPRALAGATALGPDTPAVRFDQALANREPQSTPGAILPGVAVLAEQARQALGRDPPALVGHGDCNVHAVGLRGDPDRRSLGRVTRGIGEQIVQHLHDTSPIRQYAGKLRRKVDKHGVPAVTGQERGTGLLDQLAHLGWFRRHGQRTGGDAPRIEQIGDQGAHAVRLFVDDAEELAGLRGSKVLPAVKHRRRGALDGGERGAHFVAHHPQELRPHPFKRLDRRQILHGDDDRLHLAAAWS